MRLSAGYHDLYPSSHPSDVYQFISSISSYSLDECLEICQTEKEAYEATVYLLERIGNIEIALNLLYSTLNRKILIVKKDIEKQYVLMPYCHGQ